MSDYQQDRLFRISGAIGTVEEALITVLDVLTIGDVPLQPADEAMLAERWSRVLVQVNRVTNLLPLGPWDAARD